MEDNAILMPDFRSRNMRPHIVIFNPDQWRGDVLGHLGNPAAVTPNLDRFVETDAVSFRNAFCQNTVCTPSRCSFMTGWYPHVRGHRTMYHMLHPERGEPVLLKTLKDARLLRLVGRQERPDPGAGRLRRVLRREVSARRTAASRCGSWIAKPSGAASRAATRYYSFYVGRLDTGPEGHYHDGDWANVLGAMDLIRNYDGDQPLCIYLPLTYPHPPYAVEEPWYSRDRPRGKLPPRAPDAGRAGRASPACSRASGSARACRPGRKSAGPSCAPPTTACAPGSITSSAC